MQKIEQGDVIRVSGGKVPFLVVSSDFFNSSGLAVVCPMVQTAAPDPLHVPVHTEHTDGVVLCEELATLSIRKRRCTQTTRISTSDLLEIIYRVQSIFDYFPHAE